MFDLSMTSVECIFLRELIRDSPGTFGISIDLCIRINTFPKTVITGS